MRGEICCLIGGYGQSLGDREPGEDEANHQRASEGAVLVLLAALNHHLRGMGAARGERLRG